ncbi:hypothetical protein K7472_08145 [Streptomyces sp. PTM05]|uniref:Uncharacterized protein n=1 Tax=Streptantibioticus parmotrematis TaxID=2873249 RepID=A0ABS7QNQ8_9ACTN|nr:hypothetical protein [Streptantibioticus parmotrematis]MBY8884816.1 hypothetical protein [Streptantibioticus parmotrematis]
MSTPLGTEVESTAAWLEERSAHGAAALLRRIAAQRDRALRTLAAATAGDASGDATHADGGEAARATTAVLRTELARLQAHAERAGWVADGDGRRLWRWRGGWWELSHLKRNPKDGYHDTGWYLWGPASAGHFGTWTARRRNEATVEADRLITKHLTLIREARG